MLTSKMAQYVKQTLYLYQRRALKLSVSPVLIKLPLLSIDPFHVKTSKLYVY